MESTAGLKALKLFQHFSWSLWTQHPLRFPLNNFLKTIPWFSISKTKTEEKKILPVLQVNSKICFNFQVDLARWKKPIILKIWKHLFFFFFFCRLAWSKNEKQYTLNRCPTFLVLCPHHRCFLAFFSLMYLWWFYCQCQNGASCRKFLHLRPMLSQKLQRQS